VSIELEYNWIPFQLNSKLPEKGISLDDYYANQYGTSRYPAMEIGNLNQMCERFRFPIRWLVYERSSEPNVGTTIHAHRLVHFAQRKFGSQAASRVVDHLNELYFEKAGLLSSLDNLVAVAEKADLDVSSSEVRSYLESDEDLDTVRKRIPRDIRGVPSMSINKGGRQVPLPFLSVVEEMAQQLEKSARS